MNSSGYNCYLVKSVENQIFDVRQPFVSIYKIAREYIRWARPLRVNNMWNIKVKKFGIYDSVCDVAIYSDQTVGNPLRAKNVIRYLLHSPGYHRGIAYYNFNEFHVHWDLGVKTLNFPNNKIYSGFLKVSVLLKKYYNKDGALNDRDRKGECYLVRKGKGVQFVHDSNATKIDGKNHKEVSEIFKRVKRFYSYDEHTMFSRYAVMCGCESIVISAKYSDVDSWNSNPLSRAGIALGVKDLDRVREEALSIEDILLEEERILKSQLRDVIHCATIFFEEPKYNYFRIK